MKIFTFIIPLILNFLITGERLPSTDIEKAIQAADFVGFAVYNGKSDIPDYLMLGVIECFKGDARYLAIRKYETQFFKNYPYLLIVSKSGEVVTNFLYPITMVEDLRPAAFDILNNLECYNESKAKALEHGICTREGFPVCGCDNKTYGNVCEMQKAGIMKYKTGPCK